MAVGPWRIEGELGRGGAGVVHRAVHSETGRRAALKVLHAHRTADQAERTALRREIEVLSALDHPGIVKILGQGVHDGVPWLAMDLVDGPSLRSLVPTGSVDTFDFLDDGEAAGSNDTPGISDPTASPVRPDHVVLRALGTLVHTVAWLHGQGIVHRDIKPDNVLLVDGRAVLVDFGMASIARSRDTPVDRPGGSPGYVAPEQLRGEPVDARADLYSLGCLITELWTGQRPHPTHRTPLPDPALEACVGPLLAADPTARRLDRAGLAELFGVPDTSPPSERALLRPPFLGRPDAVSALDALFEAGRGSLLVTGAPGIGKTRVLMEAYARARRLRWPVYLGRDVWHRVVSQAAQHPPSLLDTQRAGIAAAAAQLGVTHDLPAPPALTGEAARLRALDGVRLALESRISGNRPVLVVLDDLDAADPFAIDALSWIARSQRIQPRTVVLVAAWNTDTPVPKGLSDSIHRTLSLQPLDDASLTRIARTAWLEKRPDDDGRIAVAVREAEGNPLRCLEELRIGQTAFDAPFEARVIERLQRRLAPETCTFVETAALALEVLGETGSNAPLDAESVGRAAGLTGAEVSLALHRARREGFLDELGGGLVFAQRRVLDVTLGSLDPQRRAQVHQQLSGQSSGSMRAAHLARAGRRSEALQVWLTELGASAPDSASHSRAVVGAWSAWDVDAEGAPPGDLALARGRLAARWREDELARRCLGIAASSPEPGLQSQALLELVRVLPAGSREQHAALDQLCTLAEQTGDERLAIEEQVARLREQTVAGAIPLEDALAQCDVLLERAAGFASLLARVRYVRGGLLIRLQRPVEADRELERAQESGRLSADLLCGVHGNRGAAAWEQGKLAESVDHTFENIRTARRLGVIRSEISALSNLSLTLSGCAHREDAHRMAGAAFVRAVRFEQLDLLIGPALRLADDLLAWEDWRAARALATACARASTRHGNHLWQVEASVRLARAHALLGNLDAASRALAKLPLGTRDDVGGLRAVVEAVRAGRAIRPSSPDTAMILGHCGTTAAQRSAAGDVFRTWWGQTSLAVHHHWAVRFGVEGLSEPVRLGPLPADIDAMGAPLEPVLPVVAQLLEGR